MWRRYLSLTDSSLAFTDDGIGHLVAYPDGTGEVKDPMGLIGTTMVYLNDLIKKDSKNKFNFSQFTVKPAC